MLEIVEEIFCSEMVVDVVVIVIDKLLDFDKGFCK